MNKFFNVITKVIIVLAVTLGTVLIIKTPSTVLAAAKDDVCSGIGSVSGTGGCSAPAGTPTPNKIVSAAINILSVVVGIVSVIMIIIGGIKYATSSGDANNISSAKNTIMYAIIGLVVAALAQVMVRFVLYRVSTACPSGQSWSSTADACVANP